MKAGMPIKMVRTANIISMMSKISWSKALADYLKGETQSYASMVECIKDI